MYTTFITEVELVISWKGDVKDRFNAWGRDVPIQQLKIYENVIWGLRVEEQICEHSVDVEKFIFFSSHL